MKYNHIFKEKKNIIAMIHVQALPGTPNNKYSINEIIEKAIQEALIYEKAGVQSIMLENMHDVPYLNKHTGPEIISAMTAVSMEIRKVTKIPLGIQILAAANKEALAVALIAGFQFIRVEGFVFGHLADEGYIDSCAGDLLRYRKMIGADQISVFTDIKKKHSAHTLTADVSIAETAKAAEFFLSDGIIITGSSTGQEADLGEVISVKNKCSLPVLIDSGITNDNIAKYLKYADAFIIGSYFKEDGKWDNPLSEKRIDLMMTSFYKNL